MVDITVIEEKLKHLEIYLKQLRRYKDITADELEQDLEKSWIVERGLQLCIQAILDIGNHILAESGQSVEDYSKIFVELGRLGVLPQDYAQKIVGMAGFRNLLVHEYGKIDKERVASLLNNNLDDFKDFANYICEYIMTT